MDNYFQKLVNIPSSRGLTNVPETLWVIADSERWFDTLSRVEILKYKTNIRGHMTHIPTILTRFMTIQETSTMSSLRVSI